MLNFRKMIVMTVLIAFISGIISPLVLSAETLREYKLEDDREEYQILYMKEMSAMRDTPIEIHKRWYAFGKSYFPFSSKTTNFIDTGVTCVSYLKPTSYMPYGSQYAYLKKMFGGIMDLALVANKTKILTIAKYLKKYKCFSATARAISDIEGLNKGEIFAWAFRALKHNVIDRVLTLYKVGLKPNAIKVFTQISEALRNSKRLRQLARVLYLDRYLGDIPKFLNSVQDVMKSSKLLTVGKLAKLKGLVGAGKMAKAGKIVGKTLDIVGPVADVFEVFQRSADVKACVDDKAFNTVSTLGGCFAALKLAVLAGSYVPGIGTVCKVLDALLQLGEMGYSWWCERHSPLGMHKATVSSSEYKQFKKLFNKIWKEQLEPNKNIMRNSLIALEKTFPIKKVVVTDADALEVDFDIETYKKIKFASFDKMGRLIDIIAKSYNGSVRDRQNNVDIPIYPLSKALFRAMAYMVKNMPDEKEMSSAQLREKEKLKEQICIAGFYQKYMLSGSLDHYIGYKQDGAKNALQLDNSVPWYGNLLGWGADAKARDKFLKRNYEFKEFHFRLLKQDAYKILSRFDQYRKLIKAGAVGIAGNASPIAVFNLGFHYHLFEYEVLLKEFRNWDLNLVKFANRLRMFFNLSDDIKVHNEIIKHGRDELENLVKAWEYNGIVSDTVKENKKFRNPRELQFMSDRIFRSCSFRLAKEIKKTLSNGSISMTLDDAKRNMRRYESSAIYTLFNCNDAILGLLTSYEAKNEGWFFKSGAQTIKGLNLAPVPKSLSVNMPNIIVGYIREFFALYQIYCNTLGAYDMVWASRAALVKSTQEFVEQELPNPPIAVSVALTGDHLKVYNNYVIKELYNYIDLAQIAMDKDSASNLQRKYVSMRDEGRECIQKWFINKGNKLFSAIGGYMNWYSKVKVKLFEKIASLDGKIADFFIFSVHWKAWLQHDSYKNIMLYRDVTHVFSMDTAFWKGIYDEEKSRIKAALSDELDVPESHITFAPIVKSANYCSERIGVKAPVFLILEKNGEKDAGTFSTSMKKKYKVHMVH